MFCCCFVFCIQFTFVCFCAIFVNIIVSYVYFNKICKIKHIRKKCVFTILEGILNWTVGEELRSTSLTGIGFVIIATDMFNATGHHVVAITYCGCAHLSQCHHDAPTPQNSYVSVINLIT